MKELFTPITDEMIKTLHSGDMVLLSGKIITARDAAHKKLVDIIKAGDSQKEKIPEELKKQLDKQTIFYAGPAPAKPGKPIGSVGPTTAGRMDLYSPFLISKGLKVMIGKGLRGREIIEAIVKYQGIYFAAIGGAAALMAKCVKSAKLIAFEDLGTEAVRELYVEKMPLIVAIDSQGNNIYENGRQRWNRA